MSITVKVDVTQKNIDEGQSASCTECPIALALIETCGFSHAEAGATCIRFYDGNSEDEWDEPLFYAELPMEAKEFIEHFDEEIPVDPFSFEITIPEIVYNKAKG